MWLFERRSQAISYGGLSHGYSNWSADYEREAIAHRERLKGPNYASESTRALVVPGIWGR